MKKLALAIVFTLLTAMSASAFMLSGVFYDLMGRVDGKYPITMYLVKNDRNQLSGKYFYNRTVEREGVKQTSYMYLEGTFDPKTGEIHLHTWNLDDTYTEEWTGRFHGSNMGVYFEGTIKTSNGKTQTFQLMG